MVNGDRWRGTEMEEEIGTDGDARSAMRSGGCRERTRNREREKERERERERTATPLSSRSATGIEAGFN